MSASGCSQSIIRLLAYKHSSKIKIIRHAFVSEVPNLAASGQTASRRRHRQLATLPVASAAGTARRSRRGVLSARSPSGAAFDVSVLWSVVVVRPVVRTVGMAVRLETFCTEMT